MAVFLVVQCTGQGFIRDEINNAPMSGWSRTSIHSAVLPLVFFAIVGLVCWMLPERTKGE
jgi:hypothetical protein